MEVDLKLLEFTPSREIIFTMAVDEEERQHRSYELIIGQDFMKALGMDILWSTKELRWDNITIPMRTITSVQKSAAEDEFIEQLLEMIKDPDAICKATEHANYVLDAKSISR